MIDNYKDMKLHHLLEIQALAEVDAAPAAKEMMIVSILSGIAPDELRKMPEKEYEGLRRKAQFMSHPVPSVPKIVDTVTLNGTTYTVCKDMQDISTGQYIDYCTYIQGEKNLADLYSICCIPLGHKYGEGYSLDKAKEDMLEMPLDVATYITAFWNASHELSLRHSARQMEAEAKKLRREVKTPQQKEMLKKMEAEIEKLHRQVDYGGPLSRLYIQNLASRRRK